jgi:hypothetical protein
MKINEMIEITLPKDILNQLINLSINGDKTHMKDLSIIEEQDKIKDILKKFIDIKYFHYSNIFNHESPFTIHCDISAKKKSILLIPIQAYKEQKFIVFDQTVDSDKEVSWIYNIFDDKTDLELKEMYYESSLRTRPCDTDFVKGCTGLSIDEQLFEYLPYTKDLYHGLTGKAWSYTPGKALLFPANRIHATGKMQSSKIGCTIQFTTDNLEISAKTRILP